MHNNTNPHAMLEPWNAIRDRIFRSANLVTRLASKPGKARPLFICHLSAESLSLVRQLTLSGKKLPARRAALQHPSILAVDSLPRATYAAPAELAICAARALTHHQPDSTRPWSRFLPCPIYLPTFGIRSPASAAPA
jgi:hypothetical protein